MITRFSLAILLISISGYATAECVEGARTKSKFSRLNNHTGAQTGGYGAATLLKPSSRIKRNSTLEILVDSFCDSDKAILHIEGQDCDAEKVNSFKGSDFSDSYNWDFDVD